MEVRARRQFRYPYRLALAVALTGHGFAAFQFFAAGSEPTAPEVWGGQFAFLLALSLAFSIVVGTVRRFRVVAAAIVLQAIVFVLLGLPEGGYLGVELTILQVLILQLTLYFDTAAGLTGALCLIVAAALFQGPVTAWGVPLPGVSLRDLSSLVFCSLVTLVMGASLSRYARRLEQDQWQIQRLDRAVASLSTANIGFQQYAASAEEQSANRERKRISRDIHDTTGYTLVNIIMMLEDATDLAAGQPEKLHELLVKSRDLAKTGLHETRKALRALRELEDRSPQGLQAISNMTRVFEASTGVRVSLDLGNLPWTLGERIDQLLYRLVQEGMTNAFRHGKAQRIAIRFWIHEGDLIATVRDDGSGNPQFEKGIGLNGMEERVGQLGGSLNSRSMADGFEISARIPMEDRPHAEDLTGAR